MRNAIFNYGLKAVFGIMLISPILTFAQTTNPTPAPLPAATPPVRPPIDELIRTSQVYARMKNAQENQRSLEELRSREKKLKAAQRTIGELYRKPTRDELRTVEVDQELLGKYAAFLQQEDTGIVKLLDSSDCSQNSKIVVATTDCLNSKMPGAGSAFSFRTNGYRVTHLADLTFLGNSFVSPGIWSHGIMVNLGSTALETLDVQTESFKFIDSISPVFKYENAKNFSIKLVKGMDNGRFSYGSSVPVVENSTYLLRSIAYRGEVNKSIEGFVYNELDYDKRRDVIIAFRVVRKHSDDAVTILWKKLSSKDSPKIKNNNRDSDSKVKKSDVIEKISD